VTRVIPNAECFSCKGTGVEWLGDRNTGRAHPCGICGPRTALAFLLVRIGSWTAARWDQHVRDEFGDEIADGLVGLMKGSNVPKGTKSP
jgi:hypothetical protein